MKFDYSNIVGKKFGKLTVVSMLNNRYVVCRCECGNEKVVNKYTLVGGTAAKSCGCSARHRTDATETLQDMIGRRYGRLVVTAIAEEGSAASKAIVHCKCDCGNEKDVFVYHLRHGFTKSCGCIRKESARTKGKTNGAKHNEEFMGNIVGRRFGRLTVTGYKNPPKFVHDVVDRRFGESRQVEAVMAEVPAVFDRKEGVDDGFRYLVITDIFPQLSSDVRDQCAVAVINMGALLGKEIIDDQFRFIPPHSVHGKYADQSGKQFKEQKKDQDKCPDSHFIDSALFSPDGRSSFGRCLRCRRSAGGGRLFAYRGDAGCAFCRNGGLLRSSGGRSFLLTHEFSLK